MRLAIGRSVLLLVLSVTVSAEVAYNDIKFKAGHSSLRQWILPQAPPSPKDNRPNDDRVALGKMLYFDPRLSRDGNMSCATCHSPMFGWSDGLPTAKGFRSQVLGRASPTIINTGYNAIQMWDGRKKSLEDQAMGPMMANAEMNMDLGALFIFLNDSEGYRTAFERAYPGEKINETTLAKAIATYERTIVSNTSPFDQWVKGDKKALSKRQIKGFKLFIDPDKGNCAVCHSGPNFTDNGFHNLGLKSYGDKNPDLGRYAEKPLKMMMGAFKTPTIRDITTTAPYFHDGSAKDLMAVVEHYTGGGAVKTNLSPNFKRISLTDDEKQMLVEFMGSLTSPQIPTMLPSLPLN